MEQGARTACISKDKADGASPVALAMAGPIFFLTRHCIMKGYRLLLAWYLKRSLMNADCNVGGASSHVE